MHNLNTVSEFIFYEVFAMLLPTGCLLAKGTNHSKSAHRLIVDHNYEQGCCCQTLCPKRVWPQVLLF